MSFVLQKPDGKRTKHMWADGSTTFYCGRPVGPQSKYGPFPQNTYIENEDNGCCDACAEVDCNNTFRGISQWLNQPLR
jgi:hypothetical protein